MEKKQETMPLDAKSSRDVFTNICTVGPLAPNLDKLLDVDDISMVIVIDKKKEKHLRINYPKRILAQHDAFVPWSETDSEGCVWVTRCDAPPGELGHIVRECVYDENCANRHPLEDKGPC